MSKVKDDIYTYLKYQTIETLENMLATREKLLSHKHILFEEYIAIKTTTDMIEEELFLRGICYE